MYANSVATAVNNQIGIGYAARGSPAAVRPGHDHHDQPGARYRDQRQRLLPDVEQRRDGVLAQRRVPSGRQRHIVNRAGQADGLCRQRAGVINSGDHRAADGAERQRAAVATKTMTASFNLNSQARTSRPRRSTRTTRTATRHQLGQGLRLARRHAAGRRVLRQESTGSWNAYASTGTPPVPVTTDWRNGAARSGHVRLSGQPIRLPRTTHRRSPRFRTPRRQRRRPSSR